MNCVLEFRYVQYSKGSGGITNSNFSHALADGIHRLPVIRLAPTLHLIELISRFTPGGLRKCAQILKCAASKLDRLRIQHQDKSYKILYVTSMSLICCVCAAQIGRCLSRSRPVSEPNP